MSIEDCFRFTTTWPCSSVRALPIAFVISVLDYAYQWYQNHEKMMMTHEEIKEEHKDTEGDPT